MSIITDTTQAFRARLKELEPLVQEHAEILKALEALEGATGRKVSAPRKQKRSGRPRKGQPTRRDEFYRLAREQPGITVTEASKELGLSSPTALYPIAKELCDSGRLRKDGKGYSTTGPDPESAAAPVEPESK